MSRKIQTAAATLALACAMTAPMAAHAANALRVVQDPVTGELRAPNAAEVAAFERAEAQLRAASGKPVAVKKQPVEIHYPDGTVETKTGEDEMMYSVVAANADGSLTYDCLPAKEAKKFVKSSKSSSGKTAAKAGHDHQ